MSNVLALIPARSGSKGIPHKNFKPLAGKTPVDRALDVALACGIDAVLTTDRGGMIMEFVDQLGTERPVRRQVLLRPPELAQDDTPMIAVVQHALGQIPGPPDQIIVLLQPTQPLRKPGHVTQAIALLEDSGADSVVSVVELPPTHHFDWQLVIHGGSLYHPANDGETLRYVGDTSTSWRRRPVRRQDLERVYIRDGTVYAFRRAMVVEGGHLYGQDVRPLIIPPEDTCPLDTEADWAEAERRLR